MKILFIGGTGIISSASAKLCLDRGYDLYLLNRQKSIRPIPAGAQLIACDYFDRSQTLSVLHNHTFDVVVDWIAFQTGHVSFDFDLFKNKTGQYIFISSASAYETPPSKLPITENTPLKNPFWQYSREKIACEEYLINKHKSDNFPVTIVRPSHTYDHTILPFRGGYTFIHRIKKEKKVIIHGDGTSLWVLTHTDDFAKGFVGLLGNPDTIGEAFHITSDEVLTWNAIAGLIGAAIGIQPEIIHIPSDYIARFDKDIGDSLLGDKSHSMIFDNSKIKRFVPEFEATIPFAVGIKRTVDWFESNSVRQTVDEKFDALQDLIIEKFNC